MAEPGELGFQVVAQVEGQWVCSPIAWTEQAEEALPLLVDMLTLRVARQLAGSTAVRRRSPRVGQGRLRPGLRAAEVWEELVPAVASLTGPLHAFTQEPVPGATARYVLKLEDWHRWIWHLAPGAHPPRELLRVQLVPGECVEVAALRFAPGLEPFPGMNAWGADVDWPDFGASPRNS